MLFSNRNIFALFSDRNLELRQRLLFGNRGTKKSDGLAAILFYEI